MAETTSQRISVLNTQALNIDRQLRKLVSSHPQTPTINLATPTTCTTPSAKTCHHHNNTTTAAATPTNQGCTCHVRIQQLRSKREQILENLYEIAPYHRPPPDGVDLTTTLPTEMLCVIISFVDDKTKLFWVHNVCRRWKDACKTKTRVGLDLYASPMLTDKRLAILAGRFHGVCSFSLGPNTKLTAPGSAVVTSIHLQRLSLDSLNIDWDVGTFLQQVAKLCPKLRRLSLNGTKHVTDKGLIDVATKCKNLHQLRLHGCSNVTGAVFSKLAENCPELRDLRGGNSNLSDLHLDELSKGCPRLETLEVYGRDITDVGLGYVLSRLHCLQDLTLCNCRVNGDGFEKIVSKNNQMKSLWIGGGNYPVLSGGGLRAIAARCPNLTCLEMDLSGCNVVTDEDLEKLTSCKFLEELTLTKIPNITTTSLAQIVSVCSKLSTLQVLDCQRISDADLKNLKSRYPMCDCDPNDSDSDVDDDDDDDEKL
eukprot:m.176412 g.176412  ORF g.176412 m.176412 type:complete len:481 (-) comp31847_c8_seq1:1686-3128(-)